ncbi:MULTISPECIES: AraC family transcriptional regulator [Pseudomonas]|uniref:AraC family transcriptional regulator n=1 Tax=Pseudomonas saxonica TaxID=2600598 RepID=A0ABY3GN42_9PSED|nr:MULTISPECIES: AraC family transcriptional regulator [Pseudomonas]MCH4871539.1 AraC family transcriptional regulator [Pseudomonas sp. TMW22091]TWR92775.1 AraC family transcriptional regulator [Pseudomonas saxonica]
MSLLEPPHPALDPALEKQRVELADLIHRHAAQDGSFTTQVDALFVSRYSVASDFAPSLPKPALCIMAQGRKEVRLGDEHFAYDPLNYLVVSVSMPISGRVLEVSSERPVLALRLDIDPLEISTLISDAGPMGVPSKPAGRGLYVEPIDQPMLDALLRLTRLLDTPKDIAMLAPLIRREILYRLLRSPQGYRLYEIASENSQAHRVTRAISWLNGNFEQPLRIDNLAREANLSVSTLHHRFKSVTAMSPLQYQKQLRLNEARRLMLSEGLDASAAGYRVGYESPSQFSREYSRQFGAPPVRDLARLRMTS